jgi:hypothetical protein
MNLAGQRFVDGSHLSGLDFADDGRAVAFCDWDRDGDIDVWLRNRTAPRLRLMQNGTRGQRSVGLKLEGVSCNRDAIGAVVELRSSGGLQVRSVRAGEMFLSQSSKWLHFGLGKAGNVEDVVVVWPGGQREEFTGVEPGRFRLRQGGGAAVRDESPAMRGTLTPAPTMTLAKPTGSRIVLPVAAPLPQVAYRNAAAKAQVLRSNGRAKLLTLWQGDCPLSKAQLEALQRSEIAENLEVLALAVDGIETAGAAYETIDACRFSGGWGFIEEKSLAALWRWQGRMFDRTPTAAVPVSLLLDAQGRCVAIYRGLVEGETLLEDSGSLLEIDERTRWHLAPPLTGTWFTNPPAADFVDAVLLGR